MKLSEEIKNKIVEEYETWFNNQYGNSTQEEIWKDIPGYENKYQVSSFGRVKSLNYQRTGVEQFLKPKITKTGYAVVGLSAGRKSHKMYSVHRLVAEAFIPNPNNFPVVNHKDENKQNNYVDNLEWCSIFYNNIYGTHIQSVVTKLKKPVKCIELNKIYTSVSEAAKKHNVSTSSITNACKGKYKTSNSYHWEYVV